MSAAQRKSVIGELAQEIALIAPQRTILVAIDGVDGAGKTIFAHELSEMLYTLRPVVNVSVDGFHQPRAVRYGRGRQSPVGFFRDSYDYVKLKEVLLDPLSPGGSGKYRRAVFDYAADRPLVTPVDEVTEGAAVLVDGIFLHRPEVVDYWDYSIFLEVPFGISVQRCATRDGSSSDPADHSNRRYVEGQQIYFAECSPWQRATVVVDNSDLDQPRISRHTGL